MQILAYRFSAFGDIAMTVPVIKAFLEQNKEATLVMVSRKSFADLFVGIERLTFHGIDIKAYDGFSGLKKLYKELTTTYKIDAVADLHDVIRSKILNYFFKFKQIPVYKLDKGKEEKKHLTDIWNLQKHQLKYTTERYADVFRSMGLELQLSHQYPQFEVEKSGIGMAPFAQHEGKMLPLEASFEVAKALAKTHKIYFFGGGKREVEILNQWETEIPNAESLAGKLSLKEELERIKHLEVMISMDSANMHLASLMGTRCISVWGATHPYAGFLGYGQSWEDVVQVRDLTCRPCSVFGDKPCYRGDWACLHEINTNEILQKIMG